MTILTKAPDYPLSLGERLRCRRREKGWTQDQLAAHAGTNQAVIQKIENGRSLRPRKINEIASALEVSPSWLMFGEEPNSMSSLDTEARTVAETWARLPEPFRSRIRAEILHYAQTAMAS
ncbi:MAG TPA: XRE family transcriptional regulator [Sedimenticola sp.]|nr:XRE family transcriptional regulator [Sedimenticola sp.]